MKYQYPTPYPSLQFERMVRYEMKVRGISQNDLIEMLNRRTGRKIDKSYLSRFMNWHIESMTTANAIAEVLDLGELRHDLVSPRRSEYFRKTEYETRNFLEFVRKKKREEKSKNESV